MNRLTNTSSPYLLQHAEHPVHWWTWCPEAFSEAKQRGVPVLLSVGYSTCHWCHVMARESFSDPETAQFMNEHFVSIKVDREERPDIDALYMNATQALSGEGGWPMTVFLTPESKPFYAGTYFPPHESVGRPSFRRVLEHITNAWQQQHEQVLHNADILTEHLKELSTHTPRHSQIEQSQPAPELDLERAVHHLAQLYDEQYGGFGRAPKFPTPALLEFLLSQPTGRDMALHTLRAIGKGGIYDQLGGGFHRYSVDEYWLVPHFEKMLYDNAQLVRCYLRAFQQTQDPFFADIARETLGYLLREMRSTDPNFYGGFYSAQDADAAGVEGLTFTWTPDEVKEALHQAPPQTTSQTMPPLEDILEALNISEAGHFRDPHRPEFGRRSVPNQIGSNGKNVSTEIKNILLTARQKRPQPQTDRKILSSWNGLALAAFADAARILSEPSYLVVAKQIVEFVRTHLQLEDGTLQHSFLDGQAQVRGLLEDHVLYALGLVALFQASGEMQYLEDARRLWHIICKDFWNPEANVFYATGGEAEQLLVRQSNAFDSAILSDNAAALQLAYWMQAYDPELTAETDRKINGVLSSFASHMQATPSGFSGLWQVFAWQQQAQHELVIVGTPEQRATLENVARRFDLNGVALAYVPENSGLSAAQQRQAGQAYWCKNRVCHLPVSTVEELDSLLHQFVGGIEVGGIENVEQ